MNIQNTPSVVKHPSSYIAQDKKLVFTYPMLIDESLVKYTNTLRDFFSIVFVGEIKIANILNVISTTLESPGTNNNDLTPAEILHNSINNVAIPHRSQFNLNEYSQTSLRYQLNEFINQQTKVISKYITSNPRYKKLRPAISTISVMGTPIVNIPLIVGTQAYYTHTSTLYWLLLIAMVFNIELDTPTNLNKIVKYFKSFNKDQYEYLLFTDEGRQRLIDNSNYSSSYSRSTPTLTSRILDKTTDKVSDLASQVAQSQKFQHVSGLARQVAQNENLRNTSKRVLNKINPNAEELPYQSTISNMMDAVFNDVNKTIIFFNIVLNANKWDRYNGVQTHNTSLSTAVERISPLYASNIQAAKSLYHAFIANEVVMLLDSYVNLFKPQVASSQALISKLIDTGLDIDFNDIGETIIGEIQAANNSQRPNSSSAESILERLTNMCESLTKYNATKLTRQISTHELKTSYQTLEEVVNFHNSLETSANALYQIAVSLVDGLDNILSDVKPVFETIYKNIKRSFHNFFFTEDPDFGRILEPLTQNRHVHWNLVNGYPAPNPNANPTQNEVQLYNNLEQAADEATVILANITYFFFVYSFISFLCKSIDNIELEFEAVKRDATDWPNYCMVIPYDLASGLYAVAHSANFKSILKDEHQLKSLREKYHNWNISETQIKRLIDHICVRLKVPNLMVVDDKKDALYYKFMFMEKTEYIRFSTVNTYINTQHDIFITK